MWFTIDQQADYWNNNSKCIATASCISANAKRAAAKLKNDIGMFNDVIVQFKFQDMMDFETSDLRWAEGRQFRLRGWGGFESEWKSPALSESERLSDWGSTRNEDLYVELSEYGSCCNTESGSTETCGLKPG